MQKVMIDLPSNISFIFWQKQKQIHSKTAWPKALELHGCQNGKHKSRLQWNGNGHGIF